MVILAFINIAIAVRIQSIVSSRFTRCALAGLLFVANARATAIWIDTDPAIGAPWREVDDAFALLLAFRSYELTIAGISASYGNAPLSCTTHVARDLVRRFGGTVSVYEGAQSAADLGQATAASDALANTLRHGHHVTYLALAPLTNLATFARLHPELLPRVDRVYFVGGQSSPGLLRIGRRAWPKMHDANVFKDPRAVAQVLAANLPMMLAPPETGAQLMIASDDMRQLRRSGAAGEFIASRSTIWLAFWRSVAGIRGGPVFDCLPLLSLVRPDVVEVHSAFAQLNGSELRLIRTRASGVHAVTVCTGVDSSAHAEMLTRLTSAIPPKK